uniref:Hydrogenase maturation factor HypA n=1 Tax=Desulfomonile tiedjei TaxID=2358 RepID=A0A7C4ATF0_9BACT
MGEVAPRDETSGVMHEMAIVQSMVDILEEQAKRYGATKIISVSLEFGALTAVVPAAIQFAFEILSKGGLAEGARLDITIIPIKAVCQECQKEITMEDYDPFCPHCGSPALHILEGRDEMKVASMEIE